VQRAPFDFVDGESNHEPYQPSRRTLAARENGSHPKISAEGARHSVERQAGVILGERPVRVLRAGQIIELGELTATVGRVGLVPGLCGTAVTTATRAASLSPQPVSTSAAPAREAETTAGPPTQQSSFMKTRNRGLL